MEHMGYKNGGKSTCLITMFKGQTNDFFWPFSMSQTVCLLCFKAQIPVIKLRASDLKVAVYGYPQIGRWRFP